MATDPSSDLGQFHQFIGEKLTSDPALSPEDALYLWREVHPADDESGEDLADIEAALDEMGAGGEGIPLTEFDREFRRRHNLK